MDIGGVRERLSLVFLFLSFFLPHLFSQPEGRLEHFFVLYHIMTNQRSFLFRLSSFFSSSSVDRYAVICDLDCLPIYYRFCIT